MHRKRLQLAVVDIARGRNATLAVAALLLGSLDGELRDLALKVELLEQ